MCYDSCDDWPLDGLAAAAAGWPALLISVIVLGVLAALNPLRPVVFVLVLRTGRVNAIAFLAGWALALSVLFGLVVVVVGGDATGVSSAGQRIWASAGELALGAILLVVAVRRWPRGQDTTALDVAPAAVTRRLDRLDLKGAGVMGVLIQPRTLTVAAALVVARDRSGFPELVIGFALFAIVSTSALLGLLGYATRYPLTAAQRMATLQSRLEQEGTRLIAILCALAGTYLVVDGLRGLLRG